jgi:hypothetical protein
MCKEPATGGAVTRTTNAAKRGAVSFVCGAPQFDDLNIKRLSRKNYRLAASIVLQSEFSESVSVASHNAVLR